MNLMGFLEKAVPLETQVTTFQVGGEKFSVSVTAVTSGTPAEGSEPVSLFTVGEFLFSSISTIASTGSATETFWIASRGLGGDIDVTVDVNKVA